MDCSTHAYTVDISCEPYVYSLRCEKSHVEHKECTCCNMKETAKIAPQEVLDISSVIEEDHLVVREAGIASSSFLHFPNLDGRISGPTAISDQDEALGPQKIKTCPVSCYSNSLVTNKQRILSKWATFPCSLEVPLDTLSIKENNVESRAAVQHQHSSIVENLAYARTMSLPTSLKLVSAMKGGRAQNGIHPTMKLFVKWAPEVHDPPATSLSHTVKKGHHQRAKAQKKHHKNKRKGKSSRGSGAERKHANRSSASPVSDPVDARMPTAEDAAGDRLLLDGYGKSNVEVLEYAGSTHESKCGSIFLREALKSASSLVNRPQA